VFRRRLPAGLGLPGDLGPGVGDDESISEPADDDETAEESGTADDSTASKPKRARKSKEKVAETESTGGSRRYGPSAFVARVIDGDTIEVVTRGRTVDVRLIGVDTPETVHPSEPVECFGPAASQFTTSRLDGRTVQLDFDAERTDQYGRVLAYVWLNNQLFNRTLVARGFASVVIYEPNSEYATRLYGAESRAESRDKLSGVARTALTSRTRAALGVPATAIQTTKAPASRHIRLISTARKYPQAASAPSVPILTASMGMGTAWLVSR
jgi:endonuclease YncB( thermonuclease family)